MNFNWKRFSALNAQRCESPDGYNDKRGNWTIFEWLAKAAGEMGEVLEAEKKVQRVERAPPSGPIDLPALKAKGRKALFYEIADVVIYLDLVCSFLGVSLPELVIDKFNKKSAELGMDKYTFYDDRHRPEPQDAMRAVCHTLAENDQARLIPYVRMIPDGEDGYAWWVNEEETTSYVNRNLDVEWLGVDKTPEEYNERWVEVWSRLRGSEGNFRVSEESTVAVAEKIADLVDSGHEVWVRPVSEPNEEDAATAPGMYDHD